MLKHIFKEISQFSTAKPFGLEKYSVYLRVLGIGSAYQQLEHQIQTAVQNFLWSSITTLNFLKPMHATVQSRVRVCHCDSWYVGRTTQRVQERIKQHVPKTMRQKTTLTQEQELADPNQQEPSRIETAELEVETQFEP